MTKCRKFLLASVLSVFTLGSITAIASPGNRFGFGIQSFNPEKRVELILKHITSQLELNETQVAKLKAVQQQFAAQHRAMKLKYRDQFLSLLDAPKLNQSQALSLLQSRGEQMQKNAPEMIAAIAEFTDSLSNEQRAKLKQMLKQLSNRAVFGK